jgi:hypothetical protein
MLLPPLLTIFPLVIVVDPPVRRHYPGSRHFGNRCWRRVPGPKGTMLETNAIMRLPR